MIKLALFIISKSFKYNFKNIELKDEKRDLEEPREIQVSVEFLRFGEIDTMNEKYYAEICIEATWLVNKQMKSYDPKSDWNPKLYIENSLLEPKEENVYEIKRFYNMTVIKEIKSIKGVKKLRDILVTFFCFY